MDLSTHTLALETTWGGFLDKIMAFGDVSWDPHMRKSPFQAESPEALFSSNWHSMKFVLLWQASHQNQSKVSQTIDMHHPFQIKLLFCFASRTWAVHYTWNKMVPDKNTMQRLQILRHKPALAVSRKHTEHMVFVWENEPQGRILFS